MDFYSEIEKCFYVLEQKFGNNLNDFLNCNYNDLYMYHFGAGRWIRNYLLNDNSNFFRIFITAGVKNKDDMSSLILKLFYISMNIKHKNNI